MPEYSLTIAIVAIVISLFSLWFNWNHSESFFRRKEHPAVSWHSPEISRHNHNTVVTTDICNHGPKDITSIFISSLLCRGLKSKAWCRSKERIDNIPINEKLTFNITTELEEDINERFGGLFYDNGWHFKDKPKRYKIIFLLEYLPFLSETKHITRKGYYLLTPVIESGEITSWETKPIPKWQVWLP